MKDIEGTTRLVEFDYNHWTTAYILTVDGVKKLLNAKPLHNMVALDEFLPIMFDKHPEWSSKFPNRNVIAWGTKPPIIEPQFYVREPGYISDTEASNIISDVINTEV